MSLNSRSGSGGARASDHRLAWQTCPLAVTQTGTQSVQQSCALILQDATAMSSRWSRTSFQSLQALVLDFKNQRVCKLCWVVKDVY